MRVCRHTSSEGVLQAGATGAAVCAEEGTMTSMVHLGAAGGLAFWLGSQEMSDSNEEGNERKPPLVQTLGG